MQIGPFANLVGAHYWNAQEQAFASSTEEADAFASSSEALHDLMYSRSQSARSKSGAVEEWVRRLCARRQTTHARAHIAPPPLSLSLLSPFFRSRASSRLTLRPT